MRRSSPTPLALPWSMLALLLLGFGADAADAVAQPTRWHWAAIRGHRMYYAVRGSGATLVLLHGGGDSGEHSFERQLDVFSQHHRIIAPDQVGQGHTPDVTGPLSYTSMAQDTAKAITTSATDRVVTAASCRSASRRRTPRRR